MLPVVAVVGVGSIGAPMARRLLAQGHRVLVHDTDPAALAPFERGGASVARRLGDCVEADLVLVLVRTADQVRQVLWGEGGICTADTNGDRPLVAVMSTVGRAAMLELAREAQRDGVSLVDAPISGGPARAEQGQLSVLLGGDPDDLDRVGPTMHTLGSQVFDCGPVGAAQAVKVANNAIGSVNTLVAGEVFRMLDDLGLDVDLAAQVFEASSGRNWLTVSVQERLGVYGSYAETPEAFASLAAVMRKDAVLAADLMREAGGAFPTLDVLATFVEGVGTETYENWRRAGGLPVE